MLHILHNYDLRQHQIQGEFHAVRLKDLRLGFSFPLDVAAPIKHKLNFLAYWSNKMQISTDGSFDLRANLQHLCTPEKLLAYLWREFYTLLVSDDYTRGTKVLQHF